MAFRSLGIIGLLGLVACNGDKDTGSGGSSGTGDTNQAPVADGGSDVTQETADTVSLDGRGSYDPDGDAIVFHWSFDRIPTGSTITDMEAPFTTNNSAENATTFRPDAIGTYVVKLVVEDDHGKRSNADFVVVTISDATAPVADAGADQTGAVGDTFNLDGSHSYDAEGRSLTYMWSLAELPTDSTSSLSATDIAAPTFAADKAGLYIASLVVNNGLASSDPDTMLVQVSSSDPSPPTANAGADISDYDCTAVALDGSGSFDSNSEDTLTYLWTLKTKPDGSTASNSSFSSRTAMSPTFYPDMDGSYELTLAVFDGSSWSAVDTVVLTIANRLYNSEPSVEAGADQAIDDGEADCTLDGYTYACDECANQVITLGADGSVSDADSDAYTMKWEVLAGSATLSTDSKLSTTATLKDIAPTEPGACESVEFVFSLSATDCTGETGTDTVSTIVTCCGVEATTSTFKGAKKSPGKDASSPTPTALHKDSK